jgi:hypothetical protein
MHGATIKIKKTVSCFEVQHPYVEAFIQQMVSVFTDWKSELSVPKTGADDLSGIKKPTAGAVEFRTRKTCALHFIL